MPITTYNFSANQPLKGLVSDLSTALSAYMEQKGQDLTHEGQAFKNEGQKYENMYTKEKGLKAADFVKSEIERNRNLALMDALKASQLSQYGGKREELEQQKIQSEINKNNKTSTGGSSQMSKLYNDLDIARLNGDKKQEQSILREIKKKEGKGLTGASRTRMQATKVADITASYLQKLPVYYLGSGSNQEILSDLAKLKATRNPEIDNALGRRLAEAAAFQKIIPELASVQYAKANQGREPTVHARKEQEHAIKLGMPWTHGWAVNDLPKKWQEEANRLYNAHVDKISELDQQGYKDIDEGNDYNETHGEAEQTVPMKDKDGNIYDIPKSRMNEHEVQANFTPYEGE